MTNRKRWLLLILIILSFNTFAESKKNQVEYYIDKYGGRADSNNFMVRRVHQVFEKVSAVADKNYRRIPQLVVIKGFNTPDDPLIMALSDGSVVLSKRAINLLYKNVSYAHGDTRTAFVLGHELAHLANDDFWHRELIDKEKKADNYGFFYAATAGYPVNKLLGEQNFFSYWQSHRMTHPRAEQLLAHLRYLMEILPYFHFGVRLSHFGRCDDAVYFFKLFIKYFPGREPYNNLGLCQLQKARKILGKETYWLPSVLDVTTRADKLPDVFKGEKLANEFLKKAKEAFESAIKMDPTYVPAQVNLAITTLYLGEIYEARGAIEKAYKLAPNDLDIQNIRAVILYEEGKQSPYIDMWPYVIQMLEDLDQKLMAPLYNRAQLLEQRGRTSAAHEIWQTLAQRAIELPEPIRQIVCENVAWPAQPQHPAPKATWQLPVNFETKARKQKTLNQWQKSRVRIYDLFEHIYQHPNAEVLRLRDWVEMVVLKKLEHITKKDLPAYCGQPLRERRVVNGTLWTCRDWAALVVGDEVREVWVVKGSGKVSKKGNIL